MIGNFSQAADVVIALDVVFTADDPWPSLTGVTVEARAAVQSPAGSAVNGTVTVADNRVTIRFPARSIGVGNVNLEVLGSKDGLTLELVPRFNQFTVRAAIKPV